MEGRSSISAFIICFNEEANIRRALESVRWCDEIIIVDSGSTDSTLSICKEYNVKIFERPWPGFVLQKRFALEQCSKDWVLNIDSDEEVTPELREEIKEILTLDHSKVPVADGYLLLRVVFYMNKWWKKGGW